MKKSFKKVLAVGGTLGLLTLLVSAVPVSAREMEHDRTTGNSSSANTGGGSSGSFLGLVPWNADTDFGKDVTPTEEELKAQIWTVAANIATDIAIIAAYLIIGYVIYGGYLYTFSAGDPGKVATAKKTLTQAFIGLAITLSANLIMGSIRITLVSGQLKDCVRDACTTPDTMITNLINWFIGIAGVVSVVFLIYGGIMYITSTGDPSKVQKAKQTITYSLIGLAIVALSATITAFVSSAIRDANNNAFIKNIIAKELHENNKI